MDFKVRTSATSPIVTNLDCPTRDQGRVGGSFCKPGRDWGPLSTHLNRSRLQARGIRVGCVCTTCTQPALKHDMSIQTLHNAQLPIPYPLFSLLNNTARGIHCLGVHTRGRAEGLVHPGVEDPWIFHVAKCASSAGPDLGSFSSHRCSFSLPPLFLIFSEHLLDEYHAMVSLRQLCPCGDTYSVRVVGPPLGARIRTTLIMAVCACTALLLSGLAHQSGRATLGCPHKAGRSMLCASSTALLLFQ